MALAAEALWVGVHRGPSFVHCAMNMVWRVLNIRPVTFQWKF